MKQKDDLEFVPVKRFETAGELALRKLQEGRLHELPPHYLAGLSRAERQKRADLNEGDDESRQQRRARERREAKHREVKP